VQTTRLGSFCVIFTFSSLRAIIKIQTLYEFNSLLQALRLINNNLADVYKFDGYNFFCNIGKSAGQNLPLIHFHFLTRYDKEKISPLKILNNHLKYKKLKVLSPEEITSEVRRLRKYFKKTIYL
jgi:diadenosine tetraphosphate (Ap4A) HIT family hydrolase